MNKPTIVIPILFESRQPVTRAVFSPMVPDTCVLAFENHPPELHDLRKAGIFEAFSQAKRGISPRDPSILVPETQLPVRFTGPLLDAAYRPDYDSPASAELSLVFGEDDPFIHRIAPRTRKAAGEDIYFEGGRALAYSHCGDFLAAGSIDGQLTVFDLTGEEPTEVISAKEQAAITALGFQQDGRRIHYGTDFNSLKSTALNQYDDEGVDRHIYTLDDGRSVQGIKVNSIVSDLDEALLAVAGVGQEVWIVGTDEHQGAMFRASAYSSIRSLQFVAGRRELLVFGDAGLTTVQYDINDGVPVIGRTHRHEHVSKKVRLGGFHQYGEVLLLILNVLPD